MHYLTPAEQERLAYAEGYTETAAVLARLDDAHRALGQAVAQDCDELKDERDEALHQREALLNELEDIETKYHALIDERDELESDFDRVVDERDAAQSGLDEIGCKLHDTRAELAMATDKVKTYRSALMAIEAEVPEHIRQFIREVLA